MARRRVATTTSTAGRAAGNRTGTGTGTGATDDAGGATASATTVTVRLPLAHQLAKERAQTLLAKRLQRPHRVHGTQLVHLAVLLQVVGVDAVLRRHGGQVNDNVHKPRQHHVHAVSGVVLFEQGGARRQVGVGGVLEQEEAQRQRHVVKHVHPRQAAGIQQSKLVAGTRRHRLGQDAAPRHHLVQRHKPGVCRKPLATERLWRWCATATARRLAGGSRHRRRTAAACRCGGHAGSGVQCASQRICRVAVQRAAPVQLWQPVPRRGGKRAWCHIHHAGGTAHEVPQPCAQLLARLAAAQELGQVGGG